MKQIMTGLAGIILFCARGRGICGKFDLVWFFETISFYLFSVSSSVIFSLNLLDYVSFGHILFFIYLFIYFSSELAHASKQARTQLSERASKPAERLACRMRLIKHGRKRKHFVLFLSILDCSDNGKRGEGGRHGVMLSSCWESFFFPSSLFHSGFLKCSLPDSWAPDIL